LIFRRDYNNTELYTVQLFLQTTNVHARRQEIQGPGRVGWGRGFAMDVPLLLSLGSLDCGLLQAWRSCGALRGCWFRTDWLAPSGRTRLEESDWSEGVALGYGWSSPSGLPVGHGAPTELRFRLDRGFYKHDARAELRTGSQSSSLQFAPQWRMVFHALCFPIPLQVKSPCACARGWG
jgi:hypothetical protein